MATLADARNCIWYQFRKGSYKPLKTKIAKILYDICGYHRGDIVLVTDIYDNKCIIEVPFSPEMIEKEIARGSGLTTGNPCVGFPLGYVSIIE